MAAYLKYRSCLPVCRATLKISASSLWSFPNDWGTCFFLTAFAASVPFNIRLQLNTSRKWQVEQFLLLRVSDLNPCLVSTYIVLSGNNRHINLTPCQNHWTFWTSWTFHTDYGKLSKTSDKTLPPHHSEKTNTCIEHFKFKWKNIHAIKFVSNMLNALPHQSPLFKWTPFLFKTVIQKLMTINCNEVISN